MTEADGREAARSFTPVGDNTFEAVRAGSRLFVKFPGVDFCNHEDPVVQFDSYRQLGNFLRVPRVRLLERSGDLSPLLVIQEVGGTRFDQILLTKPASFADYATPFMHDLAQMWQVTAMPMDESKLAIDLRAATIETIEAVLADHEVARQANLPLKINGVTYPSLMTVCNSCLRRLRTKTDPVMTLGHGDEHLKNLFAQNREGKLGYKIIDPRIAGYYSPAYAVNTFLGTSLLFVFSYQCCQKIGDDWEINYRVNEDQLASFDVLMACTRIMIGHLKDIQGGNFLLKDYLFGNLIRSLIGRVNPKNRQFSDPNMSVHLGLAVELLLAIPCWSFSVSQGKKIVLPQALPELAHEDLRHFNHGYVLPPTQAMKVAAGCDQ